jgi:hypothetical protein
MRRDDTMPAWRHSMRRSRIRSAPAHRWSPATLRAPSALILLLIASCSPLPGPATAPAPQTGIRWQEDLERQLSQDCGASELRPSGTNGWPEDDAAIVVSGRCRPLFGTVKGPDGDIVTIIESMEVRQSSGVE